MPVIMIQTTKLMPAIHNEYKLCIIIMIMKNAFIKLSMCIRGRVTVVGAFVSVLQIDSL